MSKGFAGDLLELTDQATYVVTKAIITKQRIVVDWTEEGQQGSIVATSEDGILYRGHYGYPRPESRYNGEFKVYRGAESEVILLGQWWRTDTNDGTMWLCRLKPAPS